MMSPAGGPPSQEIPGDPPGLATKLATFVALGSLGIMVLLPLLERIPWVPFLNSELWVRHLTLWVGLFGALLASWQGRHLCIAVGEALRSTAWKTRFEFFSRAGTIGILICLTIVSGQNIFNQPWSDSAVGWLPLKIALVPMPLAFAGMAFLTFWRAREKWSFRLGIASLALLFGPAVILTPLGMEPVARIVGIVLLVLLAAVGMPLFAALGGASLLLYFMAGVPTVSVAYDAYTIASAYYLPSIPLFALVGTILARGGAPKRLVRFAQAWTSWIPGGAAVATVLACAFFTAISGASGVTILALGGLLLPVLIAAHNTERFGLGLLTASGSVGLLFPPSIPVILYAIKGQVHFKELFLAGVVPGVILLALLAGFSVSQVKHLWRDRPAFDFREARAATAVASGDLVLPIIVVVVLFKGWMTIVGVAALAAFGAIILECVVHRSLDLRNGLPKAFFETAFLVGALVAVIALAFAFSQFLIVDLIPFRIADWVTSMIHSKWAFLLVLNLLLLVVGAMMDIFSAIVIVVPLIVPLAEAFGVGHAHLGIIFLANLELGYLTPPVGLNLFLSSLTFDRPLLKVWSAVVPFVVIFALWVILVTYVPWLSQGVVELVTEMIGS